VTIGILGGGQLARMLALAGRPLDVDCLVLDPSPEACAAPICHHLVGPYDDRRLLDELVARCEVATYEFENVREDSVQYIAARIPMFPSARALTLSADRLLEKNLFSDLGIPTPRYLAVDSESALRAATASLGFPLVLKTRREGYDGKGQVVLRSDDEIPSAWSSLGPVPKIAEQFISFDREISAIGVRDRKGTVAMYPISENTHRQGILRCAIARPDDRLQQTAYDHARRLLDAMDYVGVLALELFDVDGRLLANEFAPRVHNSGHWTIEGSETSQFENHIRAVLGVPLGETRAICHTAMLNLIGELPPRAAVLGQPGTHLHLYGKSPRAGRKLGHITVRADSAAVLEKRLAALAKLPGVG